MNIPVVIVNEYDMQDASVTFGHVFETLKDQLYLSICVQDKLRFPMHERDIHIPIEEVKLFIKLLELQMNNLQGANYED